MRKSVFLILSVLLSTLLPADLYCDPVLEVRLENNVITLGTSTRLALEISWPKEEGTYKFALPQLPAPSASIVRVGESQETYLKEDKTTWIKKSFQIEIQPQDPGEFSVNSFFIPYVKGEDTSGSGGTLEVPGFTLEVREKTNNLIYYSAGAGFVIVSAAFAVIALRRKKPERREAADFLSEEDLAVKKIQGALGELKEDNAKEILKRLSDEFMSFLCKRYKAVQTRLNEKDLLEHLQEKELSLQERQRIGAIFEDIFRARYAGLGDGQREARMIAGEMTAYINSKRILGTPS